MWYFDPRIIPGTSHKLRSFWAGPYQVLKLIAPALAVILLQRRKAGELRCAETVSGRRGSSPKSGLMVR